MTGGAPDSRFQIQEAIQSRRDPIKKKLNQKETESGRD
jgi:hypothetical protein